MQKGQELIQTGPRTFGFHADAAVPAVPHRPGDPERLSRIVDEVAESDSLDTSVNVSDQALRASMHHGE